MSDDADTMTVRVPPYVKVLKIEWGLRGSAGREPQGKEIDVETVRHPAEHDPGEQYRVADACVTATVDAFIRKPPHDTWDPRHYAIEAIIGRVLPRRQIDRKWL